ncbi:hypothetical protein OH76DRAFT_1480561 [Lentinus brumalis]|uniref:Uncharacterized protein n=1 Tax=Lentinus brumalis TaxID=2498619 RepID=A0A371DIR9_9APHY|nr:hypothetical protein OH76DRAFT_1480561 [Polyporus brumalis]
MPAITIAPTFLIDDTPSSPSGSDSGNHHVISAPIHLPKPTSIPRSLSSTRDHFSVVDLPKLDTFVNSDHLPDVLAIYDKGDITNVRSGGRNTPVYYRRAYPKSERSLTKDPRRAALFLDKANCIESGRRSSVYHAPLFATLGPKGESRKSVVVAAKVANDTCRSHHLLREEAKGYASFPDQFFNASDPHPWAMGPDTPLVNHRPAMRPRCFPGWGVVMNPKSRAPLVTVPPITPKFYGFYVPLNPETMHSLARRHRECEDFQNSDCDVPNWPKSILLMEDCGEHIDPVTMPSEHREQCLQLVERMHCLGFSHGHARASNMLVQPGPLSLPRELRSMDTPSFRLISLGRWRGAYHPQVLESPQGARRAFCKGRQNDVLIAMQELGMVNASGSDEG